MKNFKFENINKPINNDVIKNALKTNFHIILGGRSNGKKCLLEMLGYKVITHEEYERLKKHEQKTSI